MGLNVKQTLLTTALFTTALSLVSLNSFASDWFEIELVLFERHGEISREQWRQDAPDIDTSRAIKLIPSRLVPSLCPDVTQADIEPVIADLKMISCRQRQQPTDSNQITVNQITEQQQVTTSPSGYQALMSDTNNSQTEQPSVTSLVLPQMFSINGINYQLKNQAIKLPVTITNAELATTLTKPHLLTTSSLQLSRLVKKLRWQKNLTPKLHIGWRQNVLPRHLAKPIRLVAGKHFNDQYHNEQQGGWEFDGLFKVYLNHYLFIEANINHKVVTMVEVANSTLETVIEEDIAEILDQSTESVSLLQVAPAEEVEALAPTIAPVSVPFLINHNLKQHRRVKSKELHYFDHPDFGLVVQIRRFKL